MLTYLITNIENAFERSEISKNRNCLSRSLNKCTTQTIPSPHHFVIYDDWKHDKSNIDSLWHERKHKINGLSDLKVMQRVQWPVAVVFVAWANLSLKNQFFFRSKLTSMSRFYRQRDEKLWARLSILRVQTFLLYTRRSIDFDYSQVQRC